MNKPYEAVWATMTGKAKEADVRPTPLSKTRTAPGNVRFGDLTASLNREVPKSDPWTGASPLLNPAPAAPAAPAAPKPNMPLIGRVGQFLDRAGGAVKAAFGGGNGVSSASAAPAAQVWMTKGNARVLAPDAAAVERLKRTGYSVEDQASPVAQAVAPPVAPQMAQELGDIFSDMGARAERDFAELSAPNMKLLSGALARVGAGKRNRGIDE
jgi:hypothetical protein